VPERGVFVLNLVSVKDVIPVAAPIDGLNGVRLIGVVCLDGWAVQLFKALAALFFASALVLKSEASASFHGSNDLEWTKNDAVATATGREARFARSQRARQAATSSMIFCSSSFGVLPCM